MGLLHDFLGCKYDIVKDTGITVYKECVDCGKRKASQKSSYLFGYQPINWRWVRGETDSLDITPTPPKGGSVLNRVSSYPTYSWSEKRYVPKVPHPAKKHVIQTGPRLLQIRYNPLHPARNYGKE